LTSVSAPTGAAAARAAEVSIIPISLDRDRSREISLIPQSPGARVRRLGLRCTRGGPAVAGLQTTQRSTFRRFGI